MAARISNNFKTRNAGYVEQAVPLDIRVLRKLGLLETGTVQTFVSPSNPDVTLIANLERVDHAYIELQTGDASIRVGLVGRPEKFGGRRWFFVDEHFRHREVLYLAGPRLLSRAGARLSYRSQSMGRFDKLHVEYKKVVRQLDGCATKGPARGRNRQRLLERKAELEAALYGI